jgi:hypothetical protein
VPRLSVAPYERTITDVLHGLVRRDPADRPRPTNKRVWASVARSMQEVIDDAFAEALRRDPDHERRWVAGLHAARSAAACVRSRAGVAMVDATDMSTPVTRGELREALE